MQYGVSGSSTRWPALRRLVTGEPRLLLRHGVMLDDALRDTRITREEVRAALRAAGVARVDAAAAVVLETDGSFSVIADEPEGEASSLHGLR